MIILHSSSFKVSFIFKSAGVYIAISSKRQYFELVYLKFLFFVLKNPKLFLSSYIY